MLILRIRSVYFSCYFCEVTLIIVFSHQFYRKVIMVSVLSTGHCTLVCVCVPYILCKYLAAVFNSILNLLRLNHVPMSIYLTNILMWWGGGGGGGGGSSSFLFFVLLAFCSLCCWCYCYPLSLCLVCCFLSTIAAALDIFSFSFSPSNFCISNKDE